MVLELKVNDLIYRDSETCPDGFTLYVIHSIRQPFPEEIELYKDKNLYGFLTMSIVDSTDQTWTDYIHLEEQPYYCDIDDRFLRLHKPAL